MSGSVDLAAITVARAAWSRLVEPGDTLAGAVVAALGPLDSISWLRRAVPVVTAGGSVAGSLPGLADATARRLDRAVGGWATRWPGLDPRRDLEAIARLGGRVLVPEGPGWPVSLADLGAAMPACLWVRGAADLAALVTRSVAVIGARACTHYGEHVTVEMAASLAQAGWTVVSGGAYGIDAAAHRGALATEGSTVAVLAGGLDRPYPAGNARLLAAVERQGALVSEVPPGAVPSRTRFLQRNRLIAAMSTGTVVVEAAWRSGAINTAGHAAGLLRPVGAVPGPVTSAASAGCHKLLRDGTAVCVTDAAEVLELVGATGELAPERAVPTAAGDGMVPEARRVLDALPVRGSATVEALTRPAGLAVGDVRAGLGSLEIAGYAVQEGGRWRRSNRGAHDGQDRTERARPVPAPPHAG